MKEELGTLIIEWIKRNHLISMFTNPKEDICIPDLARIFLEQYPSENLFDVQYAMEFLAGRTDSLHAVRSAVLRKSSKEFADAKNSKLRSLRATAIDVEVVLKNKKKELARRYFEITDKQRCATDEDTIQKCHEEKGYIREDLDVVRELSKAGVTADPLVISAMNRLDALENKESDGSGLESLGAFIKNLKQSRVN